jgi:hypothetical protein
MSLFLVASFASLSASSFPYCPACAFIQVYSMFQFSFSSVMVFFLIFSMRWLRFFLFMRESRVILLSVYYYCLLSLFPVVPLLLTFVVLDYLSICREICFIWCICSVCIWLLPILHHVHSCFYL